MMQLLKNITFFVVFVLNLCYTEKNTKKTKKANWFWRAIQWERDTFCIGYPGRTKLPIV